MRRSPAAQFRFAESYLGSRPDPCERALRGPADGPFPLDWHVAAAGDVVDGHVALLVTADDTVLTSDPEDIQRLLDARSVSATLARI